MACCGKRIAKYMPRSVGAWLCGLYDSDKSVTRAVQESLKQVFPTQDKLNNVKKAYQQPILEYCRDAITKETAHTLSDERVVSPDEAEAKYARVIATCLSVIVSLLSELQPEDVTKQQAVYDEILGQSSVWEFATSKDVPVRRSAFLSKALVSEQSGSSYDYVETLVALTNGYPTVWTEHYTGKKPVTSRLRQFLKRGSSGGPPEVWPAISNLFSSIPEAVLPHDLADAIHLLSEAHSGVTNKDEPRANASVAWKTYFVITETVCRRLSEEDQRRVAVQMLFPLIVQYIKPASEGTQWTLPGPQALTVLREALQTGLMKAIIDEHWSQMSDTLIEDVKISLPEQSKDFDKSQTAVATEGTRWATVQAEILKLDLTESQRAGLTQSIERVLRESFRVLKSRNGKPYGAAGVVDAVIRLCGHTLFEDSAMDHLVSSFVMHDLPGLILSPSCTRLMSILYSFAVHGGFSETWKTVVDTVLSASDSPVKLAALRALLYSEGMPSDRYPAASSPELQELIVQQYRLNVGGASDWTLLNHALKHSSSAMSAETVDKILTDMTNSLSMADKAPGTLHALDQVLKCNGRIIRDYIPTPNGQKLLPNLLFLSESADDRIAHKASEVSTIISRNADITASTQSMFEVLQNGLKEASPSSVSVDTLVELARKLVGDAQPPSLETVRNVLPNLSDWTAALTPFLDVSPRTALAIADPLGGAVYLASSSPTGPGTAAGVPHDPDGYSAAVRMTSYVIKLIRSVDVFDLLEYGEQAEIYYNMSLFVLLANDNLGLAGANDLWSTYTTEVEHEVFDSISEAQSTISSWLRGCNPWEAKGDSQYSFVSSVNEIFLQNSAGSQSSAYYHARAFSVAMAELVELHGWPQSRVQGFEEQLRNLRRTGDTISTIAYMTGLRQPLAGTKTITRACNELVADLTGLDVNGKPDECLEQLVLLNGIMHNQEDATESIAKQRVVFLVKHIIPWLQDSAVHVAVKAETCRSDEETNDDLVDAWKECQADAAKGLIGLLKRSQNVPDDFHQPLQMVNELLARQISKLSTTHLEQPHELYPLLYVESRPVQQTAFEILHKQIPTAQEQISFDAALEKKVANLPEELLSLVIEAPTIASIADTSFERSMPLQLRGYLFSWILIFDHFVGSSYKVKTDYIENIKDGGYLAGLLDFTFDFLGHARGRPVDASKLDLTSYTPDTESSPEKDTQWLLTHLYYLSLKYTSNLAKTWWIDCRSRQKVISVESWTEIFISPTIVADALTSASEWAATQDNPDEALTVKVSPRVREVTSSYVLDEQNLVFLIRLPSAFPLKQATCEGVNRVAISEQKWQSWLRNCQGVIAFSNNSLPEGLASIRRNILGTLKGQSECAICYSIISSDKQLPSKRCSTCKNLFHSGCLFKWFKTSNASKCPLCREPFNYG
ncbi:hypothetical protein LTR04_001330 [Oleoguttula sp. CCFEE 6159]|nr:hypothetical protein LTR04_001330 [Oleoguttula sp. CCFEE 6159]